MPKFEITLVFEAETAEAVTAAIENATFFNEPIAVTAPELVVDEPEDDGRPLSDRLKAELLADFRSWTGGFDPWQCDEEEVKEYGSCAKDHRYLEQCRVDGHS